MSTQPIEERVPKYEIMVNNALKDTQISTELALYGYPTEHLKAIKSDVDEVKDTMFAFKKEYGEQYQATLIFDKLTIDAHKYYMRFVKFARILFNDDLAAYTALMLSGQRKEDYGGWVIQVQTYYNNMLNNDGYLKEMATLNCSKKSILEGKKLLENTIKAKENQEIERGEAQIATTKRDEKIEALDKTISRLKKVCLVVFEEQPQVLEKLGIVIE